ncbi:single-stranded DNA-binding protein [Actinomycetospora endophytica]|uniref:Single-stranded DNA-binding protein n=1 Tax=Actinomycetospora endophytica TaxID=2291215 RepID=A0ABS8PJ66_9PSEU|nr:single-stranded DNA-binding protein [Actinomycetospora endophytica]MCD2198282.1 single-stranded DNA-binding protein [Actinomycetospora endophytica]
MNETWVTVVGNVASDVSWRRTANGSEVANFRLMSTERRYDAESGSWEDGNRVAVSVACWRRLSENVRTCVTKGDPVVVYGRLHVREYELDGVRRTSTDIEARSVGLDLARVSAKVVPSKPGGSDRPVADVTGLAVVDTGAGSPERDEVFAGTAAASSIFGTSVAGAQAEGDARPGGSDGGDDEPSVLAS